LWRLFFQNSFKFVFLIRSQLPVGVRLIGSKGDAMQRLIYSSSRVDDTDANGFSTEFNDIGEVAVRNNAGLGITGFLICTKTWFAQVLEGKEAAVEDLLAKIEKDPRHFNLTILSRESCSDLVFPNWGLGWQHQNIANRIVFLEHQLVHDQAPRLGQAEQVLSVARHLALEPGDTQMPIAAFMSQT
jgi:blue light- and temperature-responsive anti-repressor